MSKFAENKVADYFFTRFSLMISLFVERNIETEKIPEIVFHEIFPLKIAG